MTDRVIYHICRREEWMAARVAGSYAGSAQDRGDGFIHFSGPDQVVASAAKHRAGQTDLLLVAVDAAALGAALRWEASRGGALFPHLYGPLPLAAVRWAKPLPLGADGRHARATRPEKPAESISPARQSAQRKSKGHDVRPDLEPLQPAGAAARARRSLGVVDTR